MSATSGRYVKVYLLDDHDIVRQGLRDLLAPALDVYVVGDSASAQGAPASILRLDTDVMVLDLQLQDGSGVHVCRQVRAVSPSIQGLLLTSADDDDALAAAVLAGAAGCIVKLARSTHILSAVRALGSGQTLIDEGLRASASDHLRARAGAALPPLVEHESETLELVLAGLTDQEIADHREGDLAQTQREVGSLIDRMMPATRGRSPAGDARPGGKHRRTV